MKSWNINFLEPSGPLQARNETVLTLYVVTIKDWHLNLTLRNERAIVIALLRNVMT